MEVMDIAEITARSLNNNMPTQRGLAIVAGLCRVSVSACDAQPKVTCPRKEIAKSVFQVEVADTPGKKSNGSSCIATSSPTITA